MTWTRALYYPWIDVPDDAWLRNALLFWDHLSTIVPEDLGGPFRNVDRPYQTRSAQLLVEHDLLSPSFVSKDSGVVQIASRSLLDFLGDREWRLRLSRPRHSGERQSRSSEGFVSLHTSKVGDQVLEELQRHSFVDRSRPHESWYSVNSDVASIYLTMLAEYMAERSGVALVTNEVGLAPLADSLRLGYPAATEVQTGGTKLRLAPEQFSPQPGAADAALASCIFETIRLDDTTPIEDVLEFRRQHSMELDSFRAAIHKLTKDVYAEYPSVDAFQQAIRDTYANDVRPAITQLHRTKLGLKFKIAPDLLQATVFTAAPTLVAQAKLNALGTAATFVASAGINLKAVLVKYREERRDLLAKNPYSFVLAARANFGARMVR